MAELNKTPLHGAHIDLGARMVDFAGWSMPIQYEGITAEHEAVRTHAGLFDVSHMGELEITGPCALDYLQELVTNDVSKISDGQSIYTFMCYPDGGVVDDLIIYRLAENRYLLIVNASNKDKDVEWMEKQMEDYDVTLSDKTDALSLIAIQGPLSEQILSKITDYPLADMTFFSFADKIGCAGKECLVSRSGYTGEDGFEICLKNEDALHVWNALLAAGSDHGLKPCGLGARDTLRFEVNLPLYGNELSADISPLEAGFGIFVKLDKASFIGKEALERQKAEGLSRKIVGFEMAENGIPRGGYCVVADGKEIGHVTTGYNSPSLKRNIGFALVDAEYSKLGTEIGIQVRKRVLKAKVVKRRFYSKKQKV